MDGQCREGFEHAWRRRLFALAVAVAVVSSACTGSGFAYLQNTETKTYFKIPQEWEVFDQRDLAGGDGGFSIDLFQATSSEEWTVAFDASPKPSVENVLDVSSDHPAGLARVRPLTPEERDTYDLESLQNEIVPIDQLEQQEDALTVLSEDEIVLEDGLHGTRTIYEVRVAGGLFTLDQTALFDTSTGRVYVLVIGCRSECYEENEAMIDEGADSWTIKES